MSKIRIKHIYDELWRQNYYYICCPTYKEYMKIIKEELDFDLDEKTNTEGCFHVLEIKEMVVFVIWTKDKRMNVIAHELMHAVSYGLRNKGLPLSDDSEEAYCYLMDFLIRKIFDGDK